MLKTSSTTSTPSQKSMIEDDEVLIKKLSKFKIPAFLSSNARQTFTRLRQVFIEALILSYFNLERYIRIETDASSYTIGGVLSQLTLDSG